MSGQATALTVVGVLLRQPEQLLASADDAAERDRLALLAPKLLGITLIAAALFGLVIGS